MIATAGAPALRSVRPTSTVSAQSSSPSTPTTSTTVPYPADQSTVLAADTLERTPVSGVVDPQRYQKYIVGKAALRSATLSAVIAPPLYLLYAARRGFSLRSALRACWTIPLLGGVVGSSVAGLAVAKASPLATFRSAESIRADVRRIRAEDYFLIGASIGALTMPALFLRRVGLINGVLGGLSLGGGAGVLVDSYERFKEREAAVPAESVFATASGTATAAAAEATSPSTSTSTPAGIPTHVPTNTPMV